MMDINDVKALAQRAHGDAAEREGLFRTILAEDGRESVYAAWALTHLPASDNEHIATHRDELVRLAVSTPAVPLRRLSLALLERIEWSLEDVRTDLLDFCLEHMMLPDEPSGVRALCIKLAYHQCRLFPELREELHQSLLLMEPDELSPGVKHTRGKVMKMLSGVSRASTRRW